MVILPMCAESAASTARGWNEVARTVALHVPGEPREKIAESGEQPPIHLFISPHPDDVGLSCGGIVQRLASTGVRIVIATLFTKGPAPNSRQPFAFRLWQAQCGGNSEVIRRREDHAAA